MHTLKKFIHYYQPYKLVFFIDLICAAIISLVDLSYPQILRTMTKTFIYQRYCCHPPCTSMDRFRTPPDVPDPESLQILCKLSGTYDGCEHGTGYAPTAF